MELVKLEMELSLRNGDGKLEMEFGLQDGDGKVGDGDGEVGDGDDKRERWN